MTSWHSKVRHFRFKGRVELARDYYEQFLRRYDMPVEAHRHLVEEASAALARLSGLRERRNR